MRLRRIEELGAHAEDDVRQLARTTLGLFADVQRLHALLGAVEQFLTMDTTKTGAQQRAELQAAVWAYLDGGDSRPRSGE